MARQIKYTYQGDTKTITFSFQRFRSPYEAIASAEKIDITDFLAMQLQLEMVADGKAVKNHRDSYFRKLGFSDIILLKNPS